MHITPTLKYNIMPGCPIDNPIKEPHYSGDVGYDLGAAIQEDTLEILPGEFIDIPTFVRIELPEGYWGDIRTRSSTFAKRRLMVMPGTIDTGYRGEISIFLFNPNRQTVTVHRGDYLAQLVLLPVVTPKLDHQERDLTGSSRGDKGFGSSGGFHGVE